MIIGIKILGRSRFSRILVKGSKTEYETKKMVRVALYWFGVISSSLVRPTIFALPIFVRSKNETRYSRLSQGTSRRSSFHSSLRS